MAFRGMAAIAAVAVLTFGGAVSAQSVRDVGPPAELPPADFRGIQYVDSRGCVYIRAGVGGATNWVPRVNRNRDVLCGFRPTFAQAPAPAPASPVAPPSNRVVDLTAGLTVPSQAAAPARRPAQSAGRQPIETVASVTTPPRVGQAAAPVEAPAERQPRRVTLAEACEGRTGVQRGLIDTRSGRPVDCGPARVQNVAAPAAEPEPRRLTLAEACDGRTGLQRGLINSRTGQPVDCGPARVQTVAASAAPVAPVTSGPRRVTRAEICAEIAATGRRFVNQATGLPVRCAETPAATVVATQSAPQTRRVATVSGANGCPGEIGRFTRSNLPVRCGPQAVSPLTGGLVAGVSQSRVSARSAANARPFERPAPVSNPALVRDINPEPPAGYQRVWEDGRLNPQRGIVRGVVAPQGPGLVRISSRSVAPQSVTPETPAHRYVTVGTFGSREAAQDAAKALRARGLPMRIGVFERQGRELRLVMSGPHDSAGSLRRALGVVRGAGYPGASTGNF